MVSSVATRDPDDDIVVSPLFLEEEAVLYAPETVDCPISEGHENRRHVFGHLLVRALAAVALAVSYVHSWSKRRCVIRSAYVSSKVFINAR